MQELRFEVDLMIRVFGIDANRHAFSQDVHARNISNHGARFSGFERQLTAGDIIGVHFGGKRARCEVMSTGNPDALGRVEVGVRLVEGQACPWQEQVEMQRVNANTPLSEPRPAKDERKFPRQRIQFPIEIQNDGNVGMRLRTNAVDIAGNGCYIETRMPLPVNEILGITFWLNSKPVRTAAIVRTCDGGVGMGIEFTGLDEGSQKQLQQYVESVAARTSQSP